MKELTSTSFGYIIAFLLPGLLGLYALALWFTGINTLLEPALSPQTTIGPSLFLLFCALTLGLLLSAMRHFIFERWLCESHKFAPNVFRELRKNENLVAFTAVVEQHYRYHQFYGGCAVAMFILFPRWMWNHWSELGCLKGWATIALFALFQAMIIETARDSFVKYVNRANEIVAG
ncbi:MAG: hypothetical protein WCG81_00880 [Candidatus Angelobacter sp.]